MGRTKGWEGKSGIEDGRSGWKEGGLEGRWKEGWKEGAEGG